MCVDDDRFRLLATASRTYTNRRRIHGGLDAMLNKHGALTVVHGHCPNGGDPIFDEWCVQRIADGANVRVERYPAPWDLLGNIAGPMRNGFLVGLGADGVLACIDQGSRGATGCALLAEWAGLPVRRWTS